MNRARFLAGSIALTALLAACRRGGPAGQSEPSPAVLPDTQAQRILREQRARFVEDSIRQANAAPEAPPVTKPPGEPGQTPKPGSEVVAPERRCILDMVNTPTTRMQAIQDPTTKKYFTYVGGGISGNCRGQDITIEADSAESYEINDLHILIGHVKYREPRYAIDADRVTYFRAEERLLFQGNVHAAIPANGATLDGPQLEYFRAVQGLRSGGRITAVRRPHLILIQKDSSGRDQPPVTLDANTIVGEADSTFHASGDVLLERTDVRATADSAVLDARGQFARLMRGPIIESKGSQPFTLQGRVIDLYGSSSQLNRIIALDSASAVSAQVNLTADTIDVRLRDNRLQRAFAFGTTGAYAITPERDVVADSLDIVMPDQRIRELRAIGKAYAESDPDTLRIRTDERDWMRGDTLIAIFDSVAAGDTSRPVLRTLFASQEASAYYQVAAGDTTMRDRPGINYVTGNVIRLAFQDGEVSDVAVTGQVSGIYLTPVVADTVVSRPPGRPARPPIPLRRPPPALLTGRPR